jgi:hypothetical protein
VTSPEVLRILLSISHFPIVGLCPDCAKEPHHAHP